MYWMLVQKAQNADQGTDHQKTLTKKGRAAVDTAMHRLAIELNLKKGSMENTMANTAAKRRTRAAMQYDLQAKILWKIGSLPTFQQTQGGESKEEQLQKMQDKADVISKLQQELHRDIHAYKLSRLQDDDVSSDLSNTGTGKGAPHMATVPNRVVQGPNRGTKRQVEEASFWQPVQPEPGVPHTMVAKRGKGRHWCPQHHKWTLHTPDECKIQPVPDGDQGVAPKGGPKENF